MSARALGDALLVEGANHLRSLKFALTAWSRQHRTNGMRPPPWLDELRTAVDTALEASNPGPTDVRNTPQPAPSELNMIDTATAATILGCTDRHVRRIATSLGGHRTRNGWYFDRDAVETYRDMKGAA